MPPRIVGALLTLAVATLGPLALGPLASSSAAARADDSRLGAPQAGQCFDLTYAAASKVSIKDAPVSCSKEHTVWITKVVVIDDLKAKTVATATYASCIPAQAKAIGTLDKRYGLSLHGLFTFLPTKADRADGARWLACAVVLYGPNHSLQTSKAERPYQLVAKPKPAQRLCMDKNYYFTPCSAAHAFEPVKVVDAQVPEDPQESAGYDCPKGFKAYSSKSYGTKLLTYGTGQYTSSKKWVTCYGKAS